MYTPDTVQITATQSRQDEMRPTFTEIALLKVVHLRRSTCHVITLHLPLQVQVDALCSQGKRSGGLTMLLRSMTKDIEYLGFCRICREEARTSPPVPNVFSKDPRVNTTHGSSRLLPGSMGDHTLCSYDQTQRHQGTLVGAEGPGVRCVWSAESTECPLSSGYGP